MRSKIHSQKGFTLIELLTAVSIFAVVMTISMGSILGVFESNRKSRSLKSVMTNLNLALETMSKEIKFGDMYHCGGGNLAMPANCSGGGTILSFINQDETRITYRFENSTITREVGGSGIGIPFIAPEVVIDDMGFYVLGAGTDNTLQPKIIVRIKAHSGSGRARTDLTLQTLVSQRELDI